MLLLVLVVLDVVAKGFVEARVEDEFRNGGRIQVEDADFAIDSFPFLARMAAFGEVSATLHLEGIQERGVTIDAFDLEVDGLVFDRVSAFNGDVQVTDLDQATTTVTLSEGTIADARRDPRGHRGRRHGDRGRGHGPGRPWRAASWCSPASGVGRVGGPVPDSPASCPVTLRWRSGPVRTRSP